MFRFALNTAGFLKRNNFLFIASFCVLLFVSTLGTGAFALAPAGVTIPNTAHATYEDDNGFTYKISSNTVWVSVAQIFAIDITPSGTAASPGQSVESLFAQEVNLHYLLTNNGNGIDTYGLNTSNLTSDLYDLSDLSVYIDENQNGTIDVAEGLYDNGNPPVLSAGEVLSLIVRGTAPNGNIIGTSLIDITGTSNGDITVADSLNVAQVNLNVDGFIRAVKNADKTTVGPSDTINFTISIFNEGVDFVGGEDISNADFNNDTVLSTETGVLISDAIPFGTTFATASASGVPVNGFVVYSGTDGVWKLNEADVDAVIEVGFFIPEVVADQVLAPDQQSQLNFAVTVDTTITNTNILNSADVFYKSSGVSKTSQTNIVHIDVVFTANVIADDTDDGGASTGAGVSTDPDDVMATVTSISGYWETFTNEVWNMSAGVDTINITLDRATSALEDWDFTNSLWVAQVLPNDVVVAFYDTNGNFLSDSDGDGLPDTGVMAPNSVFEFYTKIYFPKGSRERNVVLAVLASSSMDDTVSDYTFNTIEKVLPTATEIQVETIINIAAGLSSITVTNEALTLYEYDNTGTLITTVQVYADSNGGIIFNDPVDFNKPLYKILNPGDPIAMTGSSYRLTLTNEYKGFTHYMTPHIYKSDFDQVISPGDTFTRGEVSLLVLGDGTIVLTTPLDPAGYVYDEVTNAKISGACVTWYKCTDGAPCTTSAEVAPPLYPAGLLDVYPDGFTEQENPQISGSTDTFGLDVAKGDGAFEFQIESYVGAYDGWYYIETDFDCGLPASDPSLSTQYSPIRLDNSSTWDPNAVPLEPYRGEIFFIDTAFGTFPGATAMAIPLQPSTVENLKVDKKISSAHTTIGDVVSFTITIDNPSATTTAFAVTLTDIMPKEAKYKIGSATLDGAVITPTVSSDGLLLEFNLGNMTGLKSHTIKYYVYIIPGAVEGKKVNKAFANGFLDAIQTIPLASNQALAYFTISKGVFTDKAIIIGKVFIDDNDNRLHDKNEQGVGGVKIYTEDGRYVVTDSEGKYHFDNMLPGTHILKVDSTTIPRNTELKIISNRNANDANSMFVDLFDGEMFKANFRLAPKDPDSEFDSGESFVDGSIHVTRILEGILADPNTGELTLKHSITMENISELAIYDINYNEQSPFMFRKGTSYLNDSPMSDPTVNRKKGEKGFTYAIDLLEPNETITIKYNSIVPIEESEAVAYLTFKLSSGGKEERASSVVPIIFSQMSPDIYDVTAYFGLGKFSLDDDVLKSLDAVVEILRKKGYDKVIIHCKGYTDSLRVSGSKSKGKKGYDSNLALSQKRAGAVKKYLQDKLIDLNKVEVGSSEPIEETPIEEEPTTDKTITEGRSDNKYAVKVLQSMDKALIDKRSQELKADEIEVYIIETIANYTDVTYKLYAGEFDTKAEGEKFSKEQFGVVFSVEAVKIKGFELQESEDGVYTYFIESRGASDPRVKNKKSRSGTAENRRAEASFLSFPASRYDQEIKFGDHIESGTYTMTLKADYLYPLEELYDLKLYLKLPENLNYISGTAKLNNNMATVTKEGDYYVVAQDKINGYDPYNVSMTLFLSTGMEGAAVTYIVMGKTKNGKVIPLLYSKENLGDTISSTLKLYTASEETLFEAPSKVDIEALRETLDFGIVYPERDKIQSKMSTSLKIVTTTEAQQTILLNGEVVDESYKSEETIDNILQIITTEYISVPLTEGVNTVTLLEDGEIVSERKITITGALYDIVLRTYPERAEADGIESIYVVAELIDENGEPVKENAYVDAYIDKGDIFDNEDNRFKRFADDKFKLKIIGGKGVLKLSPSNIVEARKLTLAYGDLEKEVTVKYYPQKRPWIVVGSLEGTYSDSETKNNQGSLNTMPFDHSSSKEFDTGGGVFAKGTIPGEYTVTMRYSDDDKKEENTLLKQNTPSSETDNGYPLYGDSSEQYIEAMSQDRLYLKIEKDLNSITYGDFNTDLGSDLEFNKYSRTFNGTVLNLEKENDYKIRTFLTENSQAIVRDELPGYGLSGPYKLTNSDIIENSEKITIEVRDRFNNAIILSRKTLTRYNDYTISYKDGWIIFNEPIREFDDNLNPIYIEAVYEAETLAKAQFTYGSRIDKELLDGKVKVGATHVTEDSLIEDKTLTGVDFEFDYNNKIKFTGELASTTGFDKSTLEDTSGTAEKITASYNDGTIKASSFYKRNDKEFQNPSASTANEPFETFGVKGQISLKDGSTTIKANLQSDNRSIKRDTSEVSIDKKISDKLNVNGGFRHTKESSSTDDFNYSQLTAGLSFTPTKKLSFNASREQTIAGDNDSTLYPTKTTARVNYLLTSKTTTYMQSELQQRFDKDLMVTTFGLDSRIGANTTAFTKYSIDDSISGQRSQAHTGLNHTFTINDGLSIDVGGEKVKTISGKGAGSGDYTALRTSATYLQKDYYKLTGRYEIKLHDKTKTDNLLTLGGVLKINQALSVLLRERYMESTDFIANDLLMGASFRPVEFDKWNHLAKLRWKNNSELLIDQEKFIGSIHSSYQPIREFTLSGEYAFKTVDTTGYGSAFTDLIRGKATWDITERFDTNIHGGVLKSHDARAKTNAYGAELGARLFQNAWLSGGYNFAGFKDDDFDDAQYWAKGYYMKLRIKFDETTLKGLASKFGL